MSDENRDHSAPESTPDPTPTRPEYSAPQPPPGVSFGPAAAPVASAPTATATAAPARRSIAVPVVIALVVGAVLGGAAGGGIAAASLASSGHSESTSAAKPQSITVNDPTKVNQTTAVAAKAGPSVVTINVTSSSAGEAGTGSGVILDTDGHILTNTHVVTLDGETAHGTIEVTLADGTLEKATLVGTDPTMDLAVIKLSTVPSGLTPISFGDSSDLNVGDQVVAIGAPLGLSNTVTDGIVSALNRSIEIASSAAPKDDSSSGGGNSNNGNGPFNFWNFGNGSGGSSGSQSQSSAEATIKIPVIQTDAAINPGNSGGALVDSAGKLVGINVAIASAGSSSSSSGQSGSIGVGFAIPSDVAKRIANELVDSGKATHGLLGASVTDATTKDSSTVGAVIAEAPVSGGAAAAAGIQKGDVITKFAGHPITGAADLTAQVRALAAGSKAQLTYVRDGKATTVTVTLGTLQS